MSQMKQPVKYMTGTNVSFYGLMTFCDISFQTNNKLTISLREKYTLQSSDTSESILNRYNHKQYYSFNLPQVVTDEI